MTLDTIEALEALYRPAPAAASLVKVTDHITPQLSSGTLGGRASDEAWPARAAATMW